MAICYTTSAGTLGSVVSVDELVAYGVANKFKTLSLVNKTMHDTLTFIQKCKKAGIQPVVGLDLTVGWGESVATKKRIANKLGWRLVVLAVTPVGYRNLVALSSYGCTVGIYESQPLVDWAFFAQHNQGLIAFTAGEASSPEEAEARRIFMNNQIHVASDMPVYYLNPEDYDTYLYLNRIVLNDNGWNAPPVETSTADLEEILTKFGVVSVDYEIGKNQNFMPSFGVSDTEFMKRCYDELARRGIMDDKHIARLEYELGTIVKFGYIDYFCIVADLIDYARQRCGGYFSAGRGSVGSSLVAFLLGITRVDPIAIVGFGVELPFDRFLNSGRKTMPDIDMDFLPDDRAKIVSYLAMKYGEESVGHITTIMTLGAKAAIRDLARVSGKLTPQIEAIIRAFPDDQHLTLDMIKDSSIYTSNMAVPDFTWLMEIALKLEGKAKGYGVHASGIAVSAVPMKEAVPMYKLNNRIITQFDQDQLEAIGIVKFDVLGVRTLQVIKDCLLKIRDARGLKLDLDVIPIDDPDVYEFINKTQMIGVFQWDTFNYRKVVEDVQPRNFKELVDLNTLGRSAALLSGLTEKYIERKFGRQIIEPLHPRLATLMLETYELPLYQEQIMTLFVKLAGYSMAEADDVRKAIGKKIPELMQEQKKKFADRATANGLTAKEVDDIWAMIDKFSKYTWNYGHAVAYTKICYETAYLACHYPAEYYCALIDNAKSTDVIGLYQAEMLKRGVKILPVDINKSHLTHIVTNGVVLSGFSGLKYISDTTAEKLLEIRGKGLFKSVDDFMARVPKTLINKTAMKSLVCAGAFDCFDMSLLENTLGDLKKLRMNQYNVSGRVTTDPLDLVEGFYHRDVAQLLHMPEVCLLRYVVECREIYTRKGNRQMAFVSLETAGQRDSAAIPPDQWKKVGPVKVGSLYEVKMEYGYSGPIVTDMKLLWPLAEEAKET